MEATVGDAAEAEDRPDYYGDDHLWLVLAITAHLKETGDFAFLDTELPYYEKGRDGAPLDAGSVLDHLQRALAFTWNNTGAHGLSLAGFADWNDTVNLRTGAESLFNANLFGRALQEMIALMQHLGHAALARTYQEQYTVMCKRVNGEAWDETIGGGTWYLRYFDSDGTPIGSLLNDKGTIYLNAQSRAVMSGFADPSRATQALDAARKHLNTSNGLKVGSPGYPPGAKENCGIFLHTNPWMMIAETLVGRGNLAHQYYTQINPATRNGRIDEFEVEPYVYCQNILSDEHPQFGLARNSWLTGTASWAYQAGTQYILGLRPTYAGLEIDPCIPTDWDGFRVHRVFQGATYEIGVQNPGHVSKGVANVTVDGPPITWNIVPIFEDGGTHTVKVILG